MVQGYQTETSKHEVGELVLVRYGRGAKLHHAKIVDFVHPAGKPAHWAKVPSIEILCHHSSRNYRQSAVRIVYGRRGTSYDVTCETCLKLLGRENEGES